MGKQLPKKKPCSIFPSAKKGKTRLLLKNNFTKKPVGANAKTKLWQKTPYVQNGIVLRMDRVRWKRNLKDFLNKDENRMVKILTEDGLLPDCSKMKCPFCNTSAVSPLQKRDILPPRYRCRSRHCHKFILPHYLHPVFTSRNGSEGHSLSVQGSALLMRLAGVPLSSIHILLDMNHKALERMEKNLAFVRKAYVEHCQKSMSFGTGKGKEWTEVEADEAVFDKFLLPAEDAEVQKKPMRWEQWLGMVARGKPSSLVLIRLPSTATCKRAPGPGAVKKESWLKVANTWLKNRNIILHTDSGKYVWKPPTFVRLVKHKLPDGRKITLKAGAQVVDRAWRYIKDRVKQNQHVKPKFVPPQYEYWHRGKDAWMSTGELFTWYMNTIAAKL
ncbi:unnamed protein product [Symbiodinium natans]|uniref:Uncharacterized protein n=1 Tax=Symbiodinium natans TaxID=878477 RepID=A0A812R461_9DINO|nr:unnamed protein product [Symbiodinium natans]